MPIDHTHQLTLLKDILQNQQTDCCGAVSEYQQIERLVKSLMVNENIDQNVKAVLQEIYNYGQGGQYTNNIDNHIVENQNNLSQWVNSIGDYS
ncbi:YtzH-like family protein [Bacillus kwashiorkori]|uniref:YtzH-like family protein n=1 Tax=Bacillus kwashiorkori TaxID=1522318 RepID=UPI000785D795|nr:YtzH-like family protein [Bacillus kwashiorkori]